MKAWWINKSMNQWISPAYDSKTQLTSESTKQCLSMNQWLIRSQWANDHQRMNEPVWITESVKQWVNESMIRRFNGSINQQCFIYDSMNTSAPQWNIERVSINEFTESMNQWFNHSMTHNESVNQAKSVNQWTNGAVTIQTCSMNQWINDSVSQWTTESPNQWFLLEPTNQWFLPTSSSKSAPIPSVVCNSEVQIELLRDSLMRILPASSSEKCSETVSFINVWKCKPLESSNCWEA